LHTTACFKISAKAKEKAFVEIIENGRPQEMIYELLTGGFVDATLPVTMFSDVAIEYYKSTAFHWACMNGYLDIVMILLKYDNVDIRSRERFVSEPKHFDYEPLVERYLNGITSSSWWGLSTVRPGRKFGIKLLYKYIGYLPYKIYRFSHNFPEFSRILSQLIKGV
jgi:hypothetical protein